VRSPTVFLSVTNKRLLEASSDRSCEQSLRLRSSGSRSSLPATTFGAGRMSILRRMLKGEYTPGVLQKSAEIVEKRVDEFTARAKGCCKSVGVVEKRERGLRFVNAVGWGKENIVPVLRS